MERGACPEEVSRFIMMNFPEITSITTCARTTTLLPGTSPSLLILVKQFIDKQPAIKNQNSWRGAAEGGVR